MERRKLIQWRDLFVDLVARDLNMYYRRSMLGRLWGVLHPFVILIVCLFVFQRVLNVRIQRYPVFLFCAILPWSWFAATLSRAPRSVVDNRHLVRKPYFPAQVLPMVTALSALAQYILALPLLLLLLIVFQVPLGMTVLLLPLIVGIQFLLSAGIAYLLAMANARFRDIQHAVSILLIVGFCSTPIFYDLTAIPDRFKLVYMLNPMTYLVTAYRDILLYARLPNLLAIGVLLLTSLTIFIGGYNLFVRQRKHFIEEC
jgi:ABC-type polysaccharide/polyol phosphate export permease